MKTRNYSFVVSTGMTGTRTLGKFFERFPGWSSHWEWCGHELNALDIWQMTGSKSEEELRQLFRTIYFESAIREMRDRHWFDANGLLWPLLPFVFEVWPKAKVGWIIRKPQEYCQSVYHSNVFFDAQVRHAKGKMQKGGTPHWVGAMIPKPGTDEAEAFDQMSRPERLAWWWKTTNESMLRLHKRYPDRIEPFFYNEVFGDAVGWEYFLKHLHLPECEYPTMRLGRNKTKVVFDEDTALKMECITMQLENILFYQPFP